LVIKLKTSNARDAGMPLLCAAAAIPYPGHAGVRSMHADHGLSCKLHDFARNLTFESNSSLLGFAAFALAANLVAQ
jgi:hypothetical protein